MQAGSLFVAILKGGIDFPQNLVQLETFSSTWTVIYINYYIYKKSHVVKQTQPQKANKSSFVLKALIWKGSPGNRSLRGSYVYINKQQPTNRHFLGWVQDKYLQTRPTDK